LFNYDSGLKVKCNQFLTFWLLIIN
jgi:hypothetical protein